MNTKVFITAEDQTAAAFASANANILKLGAAAGGFAALAKVAIDAIVELSRQTIGLYKEQINVADSMDEMSVRMGMSIKDLAAFQAAAEMNGSSLEAMASGTRMLAKHMTEHGEALKKAGITSRDANEAFMQLADLFKGMTDPMQRLDLATRIFGRGMGQQLLPALVQGSEGLRAIRETTDGYGAALTKLSPEAQKLNDTLYLMGINFKQAAAEGVFPLVKTFNDEMLPALREAAKEGSLLKTMWIGFGGIMKVGFADPWNQTLLGAKATLQQFAGDAEEIIASITFGEASKFHRETAQRLYAEAKKTLAAAGNAAPKPTAAAPALALPGANTDAEAAALAASLRKNGGKTTKADPFATLMHGIDERGATLAADGQATEKLTATQQFALKTMVELQNGTLALNEAKKLLLATRLEDLLAMDRENTETAIAAQQTEMVTKATKQHNDQLDQQAEKIKDTIDPLRVLRREIESINALRAAGRLSADEAAQAEARLVAEFAKSREAMIDLGEAGTGAFTEITDTIESMGNKAADAFAEMAVSGKGSFSDLVNSMIKDIIRLQAKAALDPLTKAAGNWMKEALAGLFNPPAGGAGSMGGGGSVQGNPDYVWDLHSGGIVGSGEGSGRHLRDPALFAGAPKYHGGGLAGDEMPAVLKRGEGVFTPGQMKALAPAATTEMAAREKDSIFDLIKDTLRLQAKAAFDPLTKAAGNWMKNTLGGLSVGLSAADFAAERAAHIDSAQGNVFASTDLARYRNTIVSSPTLFKFAQGGAFNTGLMGEEPGAPGEAIMPLTRMSGGDLGVKVQGGAAPAVNVSVNVINPPSAPRIEQRPDGAGGLRLDVIFDQVESHIAGNLARGQGSIAGVLATSYGASRVPV